MTDLLYLPDNDYQQRFEATVTDTSNDTTSSDGYIVLDQTLFYKEGGGQPADHGEITWDDSGAHVVDVQKSHGDIRHYVDGDLPDEGIVVEGEIDWERRYKHMRMHTAQHVVSWVALQLFDASTAGNQIHADTSRLDLSPIDLDGESIAEITSAANNIVEEARAVTKQSMSRAAVEDRVEDGRTNLDLLPESVDPLRVVIIGDEDLCPCGGTHVDNTEEIGMIDVVDHENKGAETERLTFTLSEE